MTVIKNAHEKHVRDDHCLILDEQQTKKALMQFLQADQGLHCPLAESADTVEYIDE